MPGACDHVRGNDLRQVAVALAADLTDAANSEAP